MEKLRYKAKIAYDGTYFSGFQIQPNGRTIQGELEKALTKMAKGEHVRIHGAGRTDAGVHAKGQVIHFDFPYYIKPKGMNEGLNTLITDEIVVLSVELVDESFHSRYLAKGKKYQYRVDNNRMRDPFLRHFAYHHSYPMEKESIEQALQFIKGTHDFTSFASTHSDKKNKTRTIYQASVSLDKETSEWVFTFVGDGFLYNMIRILMGTLLQVGDGRRSYKDIPKMLKAKDREAAGQTLSPVGLYMEEVYYSEEEIPGWGKGDEL